MRNNTRQALVKKAVENLVDTTFLF